MSCVLPVNVALITILLLFSITSEIGCCSITNNDISSLMYRNPNFKHDPCYIKWKTEQHDKWTQVLKGRHHIDQILAVNKAREREIRERNYLFKSQVEVVKLVNGLYGLCSLFICSILQGGNSTVVVESVGSYWLCRSWNMLPWCLSCSYTL